MKKHTVHYDPNRPVITADGKEIVDSTPIETPLHIQRPMSMAERIQLYVKTELSRQANEQGHETFAEADDFDVGDDYDPRSPYEQNFDQQHAPIIDARREEDKTPPPSGKPNKSKKPKFTEETPQDPSESDEE